MRSSESANRARMAISFSSRCLPGGRNSAAKAKSQKAISGSRQRARRERLASALIGGRSSGTREQAVRPQHQYDDQHDVDDEAAQRRGEVILAGDVGDAQQQRGEERSRNAGRAADSNHDQEVDQ